MSVNQILIHVLIITTVKMYQVNEPPTEKPLKSYYNDNDIKVHGAVLVPKDSFKELVQTIVSMRMNVHYQIHVIQLQLVQTLKVHLNVHVPLVILVTVLLALMMMNASILLQVDVIQMHFVSITELVQNFLIFSLKFSI